MNEEWNPDSWGSDPISKHADEYVSSLPDLPPVAVVLINWKQESDPELFSAAKAIGSIFYDSRAFKIFDQRFLLVILGIYSDTEVSSHALFNALAKMPFDEGAVYIAGRARFRIAPVLSQGPVRDRGAL